VWTIADPAHPDRPATSMRYPAAGTPNADVTLHLVDLDGTRTPIDWDREFFPYLAAVDWTPAGLVMLVQSRDQQGSMVLRVTTERGPARGETSVLAHDYDDAWVELVAGTPALLADGRVVTTADRDGARRLLVDGEEVTPPELQVRSVAAVDDGIWFLANPIDDATSQHVWRWDGADATPITTDDGVHTMSVGGPTIVIRTADLGRPG
jgi:dipeptidyl-peptidase-4